MTAPYTPLQQFMQTMVQVHDMRRQAALDELNQRLAESQMARDQIILAGQLPAEGREALATGDIPGAIRSVPQNIESQRAGKTAEGASAVDPAAVASQALLGALPGAVARDRFFADTLSNMSDRMKSFLAPEALSMYLTGKGVGDARMSNAVAAAPQEKIDKAVDINLGLDLDARSRAQLQMQGDIAQLNATIQRDSLALQKMLGLGELAAKEYALKIQMFGAQMDSIQKQAAAGDDMAKNIFQRWQEIQKINSDLASKRSNMTQADKDLAGLMIQSHLDYIAAAMGRPGGMNLTPQSYDILTGRNDPWFFQSKPPLFQPPPMQQTRPTLPTVLPDGTITW